MKKKLNYLRLKDQNRSKNT